MKQIKFCFSCKWIVLLGICVFMGLARGGINNAGGLFMVPVIADIGCGAGQFMLYFSVSSLASFLFLPIAGKLMGKYDMRLLLVIGLFVHAGAFALFGLMNSIWGWYLLSIPMSMGAVITTQLAGPVLISKWFKKNSGLAVGIMMAAVGLFGAILQPMAGKLISSQGWRSAYIMLGLLVIVLGVPIVLITIRDNPKQKDISFSASSKENINTADRTAPCGVTAKDARKTSAFYALLLFVFLATAAGCFGQHLPKYADQMGFDAVFAGETMGLFMVGALLGALILGILSDKIGAKITSIFAISVGIVAVLMAIVMGKNPFMFRIAFTLLGFMAASIGTLGPLLTGFVFGQKEYSAIYSVMAMGMAFAGIIALPGYGFIYDFTQSYIPVLWIICILLILCIICLLVTFAGKKNIDNSALWR